jgi:DNA-binding transcriptional ArsR family regulator
VILHHTEYYNFCNIHIFPSGRSPGRWFKALSDPTRQQVLHLLRTKPMTAGDLAEAAIERYRAGRLSHRQVGEVPGIDYCKTSGQAVVNHFKQYLQMALI